MPATVKLPTPLRRYTGQQKLAQVSGDTVGQALSDLVRQYPDIQKALFGETGELKSFVRVFVGDRDINDLQGLETPLGEDAVVSIFPPVAGA